jgi:phenylacetate-CoA ligase
MPLIRYSVGDRVTRIIYGGECACGKLLPVISAVDGRTDDTLYAANGSRIGRLDPVFKAHLPIREAQIVQESLELIRVRYVPDSGFGPSAARSIVERMRARMGRVEVVLEEVEMLPRTANGKFRAVICNLPIEERRRLAAAAYGPS